MIIKLSVKKNGNILPEAYNLLNSLPDEALNHLNHYEFHPADIYNTSLERIILAFLSLKNNLNELKDLKEEPTKLNVYNVLESQKELLHATHAHIDDCYRILKVTSPVQDMKKLDRKDRKYAKRFVLSWLRLFEHPSYSFFEEKTQNFCTSGKIVNKIKHHHARLRLLSIEGAEKSFGYYVEGKHIKDNTLKICPDPQIHPEGTAFSFSRDMAWNLYTIYIISHYLSISLAKSIKTYYGIEVIPKINKGGYLGELKEITYYIQNNNSNYFPNEYEINFPLISINESSHNTIITMNLEKKYYYRDNTNDRTIYFYQDSYEHVFHIIRPYVEYMQKRYTIKDFKEIPTKELY
ncbi:MAG: hypothetical protein Kow0019_08990 [Methanobacteriaceae archaeon]